MSHEQINFQRLLIKYIAWVEFRTGDDQLDFKSMEQYRNFWSEAELDALNEAQNEADRLPAEWLPLYSGEKR